MQACLRLSICGYRLQRLGQDLEPPLHHLLACVLAGRAAGMGTRGSESLGARARERARAFGSTRSRVQGSASLRCSEGQGPDSGRVQARGGAPGSGRSTRPPRCTPLPAGEAASGVGSAALSAGWMRVDRLPAWTAPQEAKGRRRWCGGGLPGPHPDSHPPPGCQGLAGDHRLVLRRAHGFPLPHGRARGGGEEVLRALDTCLC